MDVLVASYSNSLRSGSIPSATQNTGNNHATDSGAASEQAIVSADRAKSAIGDSSSKLSIHSPSTSDDVVNPEEVGFYLQISLHHNTN